MGKPAWKVQYEEALKVNGFRHADDREEFFRLGWMTCIATAPEAPTPPPEAVTPAAGEMERLQAFEAAALKAFDRLDRCAVYGPADAVRDLVDKARALRAGAAPTVQAEAAPAPKWNGLGDWIDRAQAVVAQPEAVKADTGAPADENGHTPRVLKLGSKGWIACADCGLILPAKRKCRGAVKISLRNEGPAALPTGADTASRAPDADGYTLDDVAMVKRAAMNFGISTEPSMEWSGEYFLGIVRKILRRASAPTPSSGSEGADTGGVDLDGARRSGFDADGAYMTINDQVPIWDAINAYMEACGGSPSSMGVRREKGVARVNYEINNMLNRRLRSLPPESSPARSGKEGDPSAALREAAPLEAVLAEFSTRDLQMNGKCNHVLTRDAQERVYAIVAKALEAQSAPKPKAEGSPSSSPEPQSPAGPASPGRDGGDTKGGGA